MERLILISKNKKHYKKSITAIIILVLTSAFLYSCGSSQGSKIVTDNPESAYLQAKARYDKQDYLDAIDDFNMIKLRFSGSSIIDKAVYYLGMSYFKREEYILAVYEFESIVKNYPSSKFAEDSRYQLAMCYYKLSPKFSLDQTYTKYAITEFQNFIDNYPKSSKVYDAGKKITELQNKLALKIYKSAELYFTLEKYKASIVYYDDVLEQYFDSDYADDALYGKIQALIIKKKYEEALEEIQRFEKYFSSSPYLSKVRNLRTKIPK